MFYRISVIQSFHLHIKIVLPFVSDLLLTFLSGFLDTIVYFDLFYIILSCPIIKFLRFESNELTSAVPIFEYQSFCGHFHKSYIIVNPVIGCSDGNCVSKSRQKYYC